MSLTSVLMISAVVVFCWMLLFWFVSIPLKNVSIVDIAWGLGFALVAVTAAVVVEGSGINRWLLPLLTTVWGARLSGYIAWRNHGKPEDKRYQAMRAYRGPSFAYSSLWYVFGLQAGILWIVSLPLQAGIYYGVEGWHVLHLIGIVIWLTGIIFETVSDYQLARFKSDPANAGQVMDRGLWRYTRHPNYFGDFLVWWGLFLVSVAGSIASTWWTIVGPLLMSWFLIRVSGVPLLEQSLRLTRPLYAEYIRRTSAFFPWCPKRA